MTKTELQNAISDLQKAIIENSKDKDLAKELSSKMELYAKQYVNEIALDCGEEEETCPGQTFCITRTKRGILYHEFGGYNIFVTPNNVALYTTLNSLFDLRKKADTITDEKEKERVELMISSVVHCLSVPKVVFLEADFTFEIATRMIEFIQKQYDKLMSEPLQEETIEKDAEYKEAALAIEDLKDTLKAS